MSVKEFKHYIPSANPSEMDLINRMLEEHPKVFTVDSRTIGRGDNVAYQVFWTASSQDMASFLWYLIAKIRRQQKKIEDAYKLPSAEKSLTN